MRGKRKEEKREIKENAQVSSLGNEMAGDTLYQDREHKGGGGLRRKLMGLGLGLGLSLKCTRVIQREMICR